MNTENTRKPLASLWNPCPIKYTLANSQKVLRIKFAMLCEFLRGNRKVPFIFFKELLTVYLGSQDKTGL